MRTWIEVWLCLALLSVGCTPYSSVTLSDQEVDQKLVAEAGRLDAEVTKAYQEHDAKLILPIASKELAGQLGAAKFPNYSFTLKPAGRLHLYYTVTKPATGQELLATSNPDVAIRLVATAEKIMVSLPIFECGPHQQKMLGTWYYQWENSDWKAKYLYLDAYSFQGLTGRDCYERAKTAMARGDWFAATPYANMSSRLTQTFSGLKFDYDQGLRELNTQLAEQQHKFFPREVKVGGEIVTLAGLFLALPTSLPKLPGAEFKPMPQIVFYSPAYASDHDWKKLCKTIVALHRECHELFPKSLEGFELVNYKPLLKPTTEEKGMLLPGKSTYVDTTTGKIL